jgi:dolichol-phosphate mannosyltransferase
MEVLVITPTYNERDNLPDLVRAVLTHVGYRVLIVDDDSPDGTGAVADALARDFPGRVEVLHRKGPRGLGRSYLEGIRLAITGTADVICQMDADWSHDPKYLPELVGRLGGDAGADLVIGSRYVKGGAVRNWGLTRKFISRGGSTFARVVLGLSPHDLTGGFKAWRRDTLAALHWDRVHSGGYVFQIEATFLASRNGAKVTEIPIVFVDRELGKSKMSRRIIFEALAVVVQLRWEELRRRPRRR